MLQWLYVVIVVVAYDVQNFKLCLHVWRVRLCDYAIHFWTILTHDCSKIDFKKQQHQLLLLDLFLAFGPPNLARNGSPSLPSAMEVYTKASTTQLLLDVQSCIHCAPAVGLPKTGRLYDII